MVKSKSVCKLSAIAAVCLVLMPTTALAYTGPGAGLTAIGSLLALVGAILLAIVGFVWYPLKRALKLGKNTKKAKAETADTPSEA